MLCLTIKELSAGQFLARSVVNPLQPTQVLIPAGTKLTDRLLNIINRLRLRSVWVEAAGTECLDRFLGEGELQTYRDMVAALATAQAAVRAGEAGETLKAAREKVLAHWVRLHDCAEIYVCPDDFAEVEETQFLFHSGTVCRLALWVALRAPFAGLLIPAVGSTFEDTVANLGLGALFHDLGLMGIDENVMGKDEWELSLRERTTYRTHPDKARRLLMPKLGSAVAEIAFAHHLHLDGTGYPSRNELSSVATEIPDTASPGARLVCLANAYDTLTRSGDYLPVEALEELNCARPHQFLPEALKAFDRCVAPFPPGMMLWLSSGHRGAVVSFKPEQPFRPTVLLLQDANGAELSERDRLEVDLLKYPKLQIQRLAGRNVGHLLPADGEGGWEGLE